MTSSKKGVLRSITSNALLIDLYPISTTASGSRLFGYVEEHWIYNLAARVRFPPKSHKIFQPNSLCFVLCYGFRVVRDSTCNKTEK